MPPRKPSVPAIEWVRDYRRDTPGNGVMHWQVRDSAGTPHAVIASRDLVYKPAELRDLLRKHMADLPNSAPSALAIVQSAIALGPQVAGDGLLTLRTGWLIEDDPKVFVLPDMTIGSPDVVHESRFATFNSTPSRIGSLRAWRRGLKKACRSSDWLVFCVAAALAGPTLRFYPGRTGLLFNLAGESGAGKTSILMAALSTVASPHGKAMSSTSITEAGLEESSLRSNDLVMCLDEFGAAMATSKQATTLINMLSYQTREGRGKTRSAAGQKTLGYEHAGWCLTAITSSENTLDVMMGEEKREAGALLRYLDIFVPAREDGGAFPQLRGTGKKPLQSADLAQSVETTLKSNYGHALPEFVRHLMKMPNFQASLRAHHDALISRLRAECPGLQSRYYEAFAKVYSAGYIAAEAKIAPFKIERLEASVMRIFSRTTAVLTAQSKQGGEDIDALLALSADATRCVPHVKGQPVANADGKVIAVTFSHHGTACMFVPSTRFRPLFPGRVKKVLKRLIEGKVLKIRPGLATYQHKVDGLVAGPLRVSGYLIDLERLRALA